MNRKISIAVGTAAAVAFAGAAMASDLVTINSSEGYTSVGSEAFMPNFLRADCGHQDGSNTYGNITGSSPEHGETMVGLAANGGYWDGGDAVPIGTEGSAASGYDMLDGTGDAFDNGLFRTDGTSYFSGLNYGWNSLADAIANPTSYQSSHDPSPFANGHDWWLDETVIGYVETKLDTDSNQGNGGEGPTTLAQNFRISLTQVGSTDLSLVSNHVDQRLEQMVELTLGSNNPNGTTGEPGNANEFEASRQTVQMAFAVNSGPNATTDNTTGSLNGHQAETFGQLVSQDVEGFFFSCINCDTQSLIDAGVEHAFTPEAIDAHYMPYVAGWQTVPTVVHAP
jgi:hypothetical protein